METSSNLPGGDRGFRVEHPRNKKLAVGWNFRRSGGWQNERFDCDRCHAVGEWRTRNCPKFHPGHINTKRIPIFGGDEESFFEYPVPKKPWYTPEFRTGKGTPYYLDEERTVDCPVAIITPKTEELLNVFGRARRAHESSGASMFGPDLGDWPIWAVDALEAIGLCDALESIARSEAEAMERG